MSIRSISVAALTLIALLMPALSMADNAIEAAESAVRNLIRVKIGGQYRVAFDSHSERLLSLSEEVVTGAGHVTAGNDWSFDRSFNYTIKVKYDGSSTRDLVLTFTNGEKHTDSGGWKKANVGNEFVHVTSPRWYEKLTSTKVLFEGTARSNVTITVFNKKNERVETNSAQVFEGRFRKTLDLPSGQYRAVITTTGWEVGDEVRFSVNEDSQDWGRPSAYLKIAEPGRGGRLTNSRVTFAGNSSERSVWLQVWDSRNNRVVDRDVPVKDRYWNSQVVLDDGSYKFTVTVGNNSETRNFSVDTGKSKPAKPGLGVQLGVSSPDRNERVRNTTVTFSGSSSENTVWLEIWNKSKNSRVYEQELEVRNRYWSRQIPLVDGAYTFTVRAGTASETRNFTVDAGKPKLDKKPSTSMVKVRVTDPSRNGLVKGPRVTVAGNSSDSAVLVQLWDDRNNKIGERRVPTVNQYFNTSIPMSPGRYRVRVTGHSGNDYEEFWFTVK